MSACLVFSLQPKRHLMYNKRKESEVGHGEEKLWFSHCVCQQRALMEVRLNVKAFERVIVLSGYLLRLSEGKKSLC